MSQTLKCANCGTRFDCGAEDEEGRCWCFGYPPLPMPSSGGESCLCPNCLKAAVQDSIAQFVEEVKSGKRPNTAPQYRRPGRPVEGIDYYMEEGLLVMSAWSHLKRGYCCGSRCRHCPYDHINVQ